LPCFRSTCNSRADPRCQSELSFPRRRSAGQRLGRTPWLGKRVGLFRRLREADDLIVIDSPPVLAVADAMSLAAQADAALFAVRWGLTPRAASNACNPRLTTPPSASC
jgi:hypothetical protein